MSLPEGTLVSLWERGGRNAGSFPKKELYVTGIPLVSPLLHGREPEPSYFGRRCRRRRRMIAAFQRKAEAPKGPDVTYSVFHELSVFLRAIAQLHSGRAIKRKAPLFISFPLEGNAAKRQRVYEVKNDNVAPLLLYAGPTLPDLAILCRIAT